MGNLDKESNLNPKNVQDSYESSIGLNDEEYTRAVDNGSYSNFVNDKVGYGLPQLTYPSRKRNFLEFVRSYGCSIGDLDIQLLFITVELQNEYVGLWRELCSTTDLYSATANICIKYENPAVKNIRDRYNSALNFYNQFTHPSSSGFTDSGSRTILVETAKKFLGCNEADGSHRQIIDIYNKYAATHGLYKMSYSDPWCCAYASAMVIHSGFEKSMPVGVNCEHLIQEFRNKNRWVENDEYVPKPGDYIFYDWQDSGFSDCTGGSDHVGIVTDVSGSTITVIEGNKSDAVGYRNIQVNGKFIRGFGIFEGQSSGFNDNKPSPLKSIDEIAREVIAGKWGNGDLRKTRLTQAGYNVKAVQDKVNLIMSGKDTAPPAKKSIDILAKEVLQDVWGTGEERKKRLTGAGYDYWQVQKRVNSILSGNNFCNPSPSPSPPPTYTVVSGDTLSGIAKRVLGNPNRYHEIKRINNLKSDIIYPGQVLKIPE